MDDYLKDKEARFKRQQEILRRNNSGDKGKNVWRNANHNLYHKKPPLKPADKQKLIDEVNTHINQIDYL